MKKQTLQITLIVLIALAICFAGCTSVKESSLKKHCNGNTKMRTNQGYSSKCFKF
jgi:outer membrane protein assembly factor BamE (lipoprotein component of BamABCDE complex)